MTTKERLHKLVDDLSDEEAAATFVIVERRKDDPMLQALASAPADEEPSDAAEALLARTGRVGLCRSASRRVEPRLTSSWFPQITPPARRI